MTYIAEALNTAVMRNPSCASPDTKVIEAMTAMSRISDTSTSCIVVVEHEQVVGFLTERDMLRLAIQQLPLEHLTLRQVLGHPPVTIRESALNDLSTVLNLFEQLQVSHLPIVDDSDRLVGLISNSSLHQILSSIALQQANNQEQLQMDLLRQQSEARLRASEQRYVSLVAASPVGIVHTDLEGICTYANERYCEIVGVEPAKLIGKSWFQGHTPDNLERINQEFEQSLRENRPFHLEYSIQRPDGAEVWVYGQAVVEYDTEGQKIGYIGTATDISDRKLAESLLASQHKILERIARGDLLSDILETLLKTMESYLTGAICTIMLCRDGQLYAMAAPSLPQDYVKELEKYDFPIAEGVGSCGTAAFRRELVVVTDIENDPLWQNYKSLALDYGLQACSSFPIFASDQRLFGIFGIYYRGKKAPQPRELEWIAQAANIAGIAIEREQAVQELKWLTQDLENLVQERTIELQKSERRYASLAAAAPVGIFRFDAPLHCVYVNEHWSEMTGRPMESALGYGWMEALHPDDRKQAIAVWSKGYDQELPKALTMSGEEGRHLRPDGTVNWFYVQVAQEFDDVGNVVGYIGTLTDITELKNVEIALQETETKFQRITESLPGMIYRYILHPDGSDEVTYISPQVRQIYELEPEVVLQDVSRLWARIHPEDIPDSQKAVQASAQSLHPFFIEQRLILPKAGLKWIQVSSSPERQDNGDVIWDGVAIDITDRKKLEQEQTKLTEILEATPDYIGMVNAQGEILWHNKQLRKLRPEIGDPKDHRIVTECHPDWANKIIAEQALPIASQEGSWSGELALLDGNGGEIPVSQVIIAHKSADGIVENFSTIMRDISDRKQAETALKRELLRRSIIFDASPDGIHILDKEGNLLEANERFVSMLGYTPVEALQLNVADWDAQWNKEELQSIFQNFQWSLSQVWVFETRHRRKDGSVFPVEISECPMEWNGELAVVCLSRDITDRKLAEEQLQRTNQELIRATRLKDEFLANMSHELRTPLNAILGMSEALQEMVFGSLNEKQVRCIKTIEDSGTHLLALINDILDVAKIESGQIKLDLQLADIGVLCSSSVTFIKQQALRKNIKISTNIKTQLPKLLVDERRILQVLINLLNNAVKFTPEHGRITLEVSYHQQSENPKPLRLQDPTNHHSGNASEQTSVTLPTRSYIKISITDTGIGIASEDIKRLFQPFIQIDSALNRQYTGTGLGLALVKQITELHGGDVNLTSEVGIGSCFSVELPCHVVEPISDPTRTPEHTTQLQPSSPDKIEVSHLILIAEDNEANISTIVGYLEIFGYRLIIANNGLEAIALAKSEHPDLILMDIQMPIMDGIEAMQQIRQDSQLQNTPIIALTALAMNGDEERCLSAGATSYLCKPIKLKQLNELIQQLVGNRKLVTND